MKISLISPYTNISAYGLRSISACLKNDGHEVSMIFLPNKYDKKYEEVVLSELVELVKDAELIGISLMTNHFDNVVQLTKRLKVAINAPIIWGGIHPTIRPEECLNCVDIVCVGEGEESFLELVKKMQVGEDYYKVLGLWFKKDGEIIKNKLRSLQQNLDAIPFQDYEIETHYILVNGHIQKMDKEILSNQLKRDYSTQPTRGCPFSCTYCCNNTLNRMYSDQRLRVRKRSVYNIINELVRAKSKLTFINHITFDSDAFFLYSQAEIKEFCREYKQKVNLPLHIGGVTPTAVTKESIAMLVDAGLTGITMGIQSGSERTKKQYQRNHSNQQVINVAKIINGFKGKLFPRYDVIIDNPWETDEDLMETLMFLTKIPAPYELSLFSLTLFPETELYYKAIKDGLIANEKQAVYRKNYNVRLNKMIAGPTKRSYLYSLFHLLYVYGLGGQSVSAKTMSRLIDCGRHPFTSRLLYFIMGLRAKIILEKYLAQEKYFAMKEEKFNKKHYSLLLD
ncbi:MAG: radical SAM protein [bacterium]